MAAVRDDSRRFLRGSDTVQLWVVDVSGEAPGTATRVDTLGGGTGVELGAKFSPDDALVEFGEQSLEFGGPEPLRLIDRSTPDESVLIGDNARSAAGRCVRQQRRAAPAVGWAFFFLKT